MFPRADEAPFIQNINRLMYQPGKIDRAFVFQRRFPRFNSGAISLTRLPNRSRTSSGAPAIISACDPRAFASG
jgi:hypothetical protein